jgi:xylan 1,4-beta-xylosidase
MKRVNKLLILLCLLSSQTLLFAQKEQKTISSKTIAADFHSIKGDMDDFFKQCVGAGRAHEGLRADWQQQLLEIKRECDFKQIRFHALFHDEMGVYREDSAGIHFNWQYIDALYDYLVSIDVKPFIEMAFTPKDLKSGEETIFWWKGNVSPPSDYNKWELLVKNFALHLKERYGEDEVASWYFEVWNEPNLKGFFNGTMEEYFKLYDYSARGVKAASTRFRIGGPSTAGLGWIPEIMEYCKKNNVPLDFITTHHYGVDGYLDEYGVFQLVMPGNADGYPQTIARIVQQVIDSDYPVEVHFTEWSSSYSPRDPIHDTYQNAAFVLNALRKMHPTPASMSYWTFTDIFEEPGPVLTPFHGGFGLMNMQGIKKPAYYAYKFLSELGNKELTNDDKESWVCTNGKDEIQALFWDITMLDQNKAPNQIFYRREHPSSKVNDTRLSLTNLPNGKYVREVYRIGYRQNDAFTSYYDLGLPSQLTKVQVEMIKSFADGSPVCREIITIEDGVYGEVFPVRENDVYFVKLKKVI